MLLFLARDNVLQVLVASVKEPPEPYERVTKLSFAFFTFLRGFGFVEEFSV
jgi:hypothetical protein